MTTKPILGVMALYINSKKQFDERSYLKKLMIQGEKMGMKIFLFSPENVDEKNKKIYAYFFNKAKSMWVRKWTDFPDIIFDRCRYQATSRFKQLKKFREKNPHIIYLNRPLSNKWIIHEKLSDNNAVKEFLPNSTFISKLDDLLQFLKHSKVTFFKPINGTGGTGILKIKKVEDHKYLIQGRKHNRKIIPKQLINKSQLLGLCKNLNAKKPYMAQQGIDIKLDNGRVHDYRLLIQKNHIGEWVVTGCAGRIGAKRSVTSNLHGGGSAVPADRLLKYWFKEHQIKSIKQNMEQLSYAVVTELESQNYELCELALDIAVDRSGKIWLLEVNPKPARKVFLKIGEEKTYTKAIVRPLEYALWLYNKGNSPIGALRRR
ncbi:YheC/YheD family protein [Chengkuizengella sediminis]|uniref:YheC/YheD family endospore coat-associated protein n=1 Tax=Chengkuizengella sediminis TaxID=1885917 RepID=UPI0013898D96|nr:YheC/YheD family protein [Chengkuizengella sediminis]NDI36298.1 YheC/YheD family protein [Chengkuizengella sediminis]